MNRTTPLFLFLWIPLFQITPVHSQERIKPIPPQVTLIRVNGPTYEEMSKLLHAGMQNNYTVNDIIIYPKSSFKEFSATLRKTNPNLLVLMDNLAVRYAIEYNNRLPDPTKKLKGVALLTLNLDSILKGIPEFSGIAYELSPVLLSSQFRYFLKTPLKQLIVFYRKSIFQSRIEKSKNILKEEGIALNAIDVEQTGSSKEEISAFMEKTLPNVVQNASPNDALWLLLDSAIINQESLDTLWRPLFAQSKLPVLSSVDNLVNTEMHFATFVMTPNLPDLANQALQQIHAIVSRQKTPSTFGVQEILSVDMIFNLTRAQEIDLKFDESRLDDVKIIK